MRSHWKVGWVARFTRGYWRTCSAIGMSHETASLIVATVPELPSVLLSAQEERPHDYNSRGGGCEYSRATASEAQDWLIISLHGFPIIDMQTALGSDLSDCDTLESPGYLTPANPGRQERSRPRRSASLPATGDPMNPGNIRDGSVSRQGARFVLS